MARWVLGLRKAVSLLLANGHSEASRYPIGRVFLEADIVRERLDQERAAQSVLMQLCVGSLLDREAGKQFSKQIQEMTSGG